MCVNERRERGGADEERAERERWQNRERQKIMDSVNCALPACPLFHSIALSPSPSCSHL